MGFDSHSFGFEDSASNETRRLTLHPAACVLAEAGFIVAVVSFGRYELSALAPFLLIVVLVSAWQGVSVRRMLPQLGAALIIALFTGAAGLFFRTDAAFYLGSIPVSYGLISCLTLLLKTALCVFSVSFLAYRLGTRRTIGALRWLKVPNLLILQITLTFRYLHVLFQEFISLALAYRLRSGLKRGVAVQDAGPFVGGLLLRSYQRAELLYEAMKLRGFDGTFEDSAVSHWRVRDTVFLASTALLLFLLCWFDPMRYFGFFIQNLF